MFSKISSRRSEKNHILQMNKHFTNFISKCFKTLKSYSLRFKHKRLVLFREWKIFISHCTMNVPVP